jgi:hypothetical protein
MIIKQLSIFLQNKVGRFNDILMLLGDAGINLKAFTVSESSDYGILRLITDDQYRAKEVLLGNSYAVSTTEVVYLECGDYPGELSQYMKKVADANISIEYMYAFSDGDKARVIIRTDDIERCDEVLRK